jgi:hypothetical protein
MIRSLKLTLVLALPKIREQLFPCEFCDVAQQNGKKKELTPDNLHCFALLLFFCLLACLLVSLLLLELKLSTIALSPLHI